MADRPQASDNDGAYQSFLAIRMEPWPEAAELDELRARLGDEQVDLMLAPDRYRQPSGRD